MKRFIIVSLSCFILVVTASCVITNPAKNTPHGAKYCRSDYDCPDGWSCQFPHVDSYAVCMQGGDTKWEEYTPPLKY